MIRSAGIEPRRAALTILADVRGGKPFDVALDHRLGALPQPDRRLAHELAAGVLRQRSALDRRLAPLVARGWDSVGADLQDVLRLGAYQLTALERVPPHAALDTTVALAKGVGGVRAAGFVNAVLRRLARSEPPARTDGATDPAALAAQYSHPPWLVERWIAAFGLPGTAALLRWNNTRPRLVLQPAREDRRRLISRWQSQGIRVDDAPYGAGLMPDRSRPAELPGYVEGSFMVQDPAQALLARYVDPPPHALLYDACAAPGGKTIALGRQSGTIVAGDVSHSRARRLAENLRRAGSGREYVVVADARRPPVPSVDVVLLDAPCLGTGTFARNPDARWRITPEALSELMKLQSELLERLAPVVAPGGLLVYSTCSLEPEENQRQVERFLADHPEFQRDPGDQVARSLLSAEGDLTILPQQHHMDGAYAARLRREV